MKYVVLSFLCKQLTDLNFEENTKSFALIVFPRKFQTDQSALEVLFMF